MTLLLPQDHALLDQLEAKCCNHPDLLSALKRLRADHLAMTRLNVELMGAELERLTAKPAELREAA